MLGFLTQYTSTLSKEVNGTERSKEGKEEKEGKKERKEEGKKAKEGREGNHIGDAHVPTFSDRTMDPKGNQQQGQQEEGRRKSGRGARSPGHEGAGALSRRAFFQGKATPSPRRAAPSSKQGPPALRSGGTRGRFPAPRAPSRGPPGS